MDSTTVIATALGGVLPGTVLAGIAAAGFLLGGSAPASAFDLQGLPETTVHNYRFAEQHQEVLVRTPCYCGCQGLGHRNLFDCFVRPNGGYEVHASGCNICGREADEVERMLGEGAEMAAIRTAIDLAYGSYGRGTDTP